MKRSLFVALTLMLTLLVFAGCSQRIGDFTIISSKNVDIGGKYKMISRLEGVHKTMSILGIPLGKPDLKQAVDNCIEAATPKGDLIANAVIESSFWTVIIVGQQGYTVIGDVWGKAGMSDLLNPDIELYELQVSTSSVGYELVSTVDPSKRLKVERFLASR